MNLRIVVEWLTFLLLIREVLGSNLGQETGYPDMVFLNASNQKPK
jgi:hypothetical protein